MRTGIAQRDRQAAAPIAPLLRSDSNADSAMRAQRRPFLLAEIELTPSIHGVNRRESMSGSISLISGEAIVIASLP